MVFTSFTTDATGQHPWFQEVNDRSHHAISTTIYDLLDGLSDPRADLWFGTVGGAVVPAPNGTAVTDQGGNIYSGASGSYLTATSPLPIITYDEMKFLEGFCVEQFPAVQVNGDPFDIEQRLQNYFDLSGGGIDSGVSEFLFGPLDQLVKFLFIHILHRQ